jgi:RNA polymerase sigma factor (sigma-70 family)
VTESILNRVGRGDVAAVSECMERFGGLVWSVARRYCTNAAEAEDAVQEIFIDLWRSAARFDATIASETTFVAMIARRRLIDRGRRKARRPESAMIPETVADSPQGPGGSPAMTEISEDARLATDALATLRPEQQRVLQLSIFHGASHEQIARSTGLPLGTVKTHARRGLIRMRELLEQKRSERGSGATSTADPSEVQS